ncbi:elongation factor P--(R)-beta-lysine ligase [Alteromonas sp. 5E99-2]|uniref:elongation factor P--(R)-beta-lysine ligase n=1 Tax=Alteromonas sp. 5E99-2 TaxID=2817683 RepID=UPI001A998C71|nr:elongation factor P--(R)-beta-lysine ligase [Alteromonas sp. 5E99-2]
MHKNNWRPSASIEQLKKRAQLLSQLRRFFESRDVLEISAPVLASAGVTDPFIDNFSTQFSFSAQSSEQTLYLQSSPEYAMKRLLAAGCEHIYSIGPAFRHEGAGSNHNPEFTMLEWYRSGFDMQMLIDEVSDLLKTTLNIENISQYSYQDVFLKHMNIDPLTATTDELIEAVKLKGIDLYNGFETLDNDDLLQMLFSHCIEPSFANHCPVIVTHFPASQASLARINSLDNRVANRFEVYFKGIELANGFHELSDANEQAARFESDNKKRSALNFPTKPIDQYLLTALDAGLPDCSGVALGVDRLLMLIVGASHIRDVLTFDIARA